MIIKGSTFFIVPVVLYLLFSLLSYVNINFTDIINSLIHSWNTHEWCCTNIIASRIIFISCYLVIEMAYALFSSGFYALIHDNDNGPYENWITFNTKNYLKFLSPLAVTLMILRYTKQFLDNKLTWEI